MNKFLLVVLLTALASFNLYAADLAIVNGKPVKQSLLDYIVSEATSHGRKVDDAARATIIDKLIVGELIDQEAQKSDITKKPAFIALQELTLQELRVKAYIEDYIRNHPSDENTLKAEYEKLKSQTSGKEFKARHILVKTEEEAGALLAQLDKGADFAQLAREKSLDSSKDSGGDLGWFTPDSMVQPFSDAVVKLKKGSITSTPVQTEFGWHVIKLEDARDATPPSFDAVRKELANELQKRQLDQLVSTLRAKAKIETSAGSQPSK